MKRRELIQLSSLPLVLSAVSPARSLGAQEESAAGAAEFGLESAAFRLTLSVRDGLRCRLVHVSTGNVLADGQYFYSFGNPVFTSIKHDSFAILLLGKVAGELLVEHRFVIDPRKDWLEEQLKITNLSKAPLELSAVRCGFVLPVKLQEEKALPHDQQNRFAAVPFLREPGGSAHRYMDYSLSQVITEEYYSTMWERYVSITERVTPRFASEGWVWTRGKCTCLISKYSQAGMEWSLLDRGLLSDESSGFRWGGFGIYRDQPEHAAWLRPGQSHQFGVTRLTAVAGGRLQAYYAFRNEMAQRGHGCPPEFNPPLHWNELYDNKLLSPSGDMDNVENRKKYYSLADMKYAAGQAKAYGCEALYLDPGWDTNFASKIWDDARLGSLKSFTSMLRSEYGLKCSLHTPLAGWCNPSTYSQECYRMLPDGKRLTWDETAWLAGGSGELRLFQPPICGASRQYVDETVKRLSALARDGAVYFMFDGTAYHDECWDPAHGHAVPARMEEHTQAVARIARMVHDEYSDVLIEMHDPVAGGARSHFTPLYYGHGRCVSGEGQCTAAGFDSVWAFELMWNPMDDLLSGRSISLYYYNLAYSLPLYIHIDLRTDNQNCLVFWWNASTCRHLGIGGTHADPGTVDAHKRAVALYKRLKPYYSKGIFYGIDEMTHVHAAVDGSRAVINCFNLTDKPMQREIRLEPLSVGLNTSKAYKFNGAHFSRSGSGWVGTVTIAARGHTLVEAV